MTEIEFEKKVKEILPLVLTYATDFYDVKGRRDLSAVLKRVGSKTFADKCHEGFKVAQPKIVDALVGIERDNVLLTAQLKQARVARDKDKIGETSLQAKTLALQKAVFQELANVIVWTLFKMERTDIKAFMQPDMNNKSLLESNLNSLIKTADRYNKQSNKFALISDITSCVGMGDLLVVDTEKKTRLVVEIKEGAMNEIILKTLSKGDFGIVENYLESLTDIKDTKSFIKQFNRVIQQHQKTSDALKYSKSGTGKDLFTGRQKRIIDLTQVKEEKYSKQIFKVIKKLYSGNANSGEAYFPFDSGVVAIIRNPSLSKKWDFQHFIYHAVINQNKDCAYTHFTGDGIKAFIHPEVRLHFEELQSVPIYDIKSKVFCFTHQPIFFNIPKEYASDLFVDKLGIYTYFDLDRFIFCCSAAGLNPSLNDFEKALRGEIKHLRDLVVRFGDKCLMYGTEDKRFKFTKGLLFRIIFEFQTAESVIKQMKGMVESVSKEKFQTDNQKL